MSRDFDDIYKKIDQSHKELYRKEADSIKDLNELKKDQTKISKDISDIKKQIQDITSKIDIVLEILNNFTIMLAEDDEDLEENYDLEDTDETWVPKEDNFWENDDEV